MSILFWRRLSQVAVALAFIAIPILNLYEYDYLIGNFLSFNFAGLPLADPLSVAQAAARSGSATKDMLIGAGAVLLIAALLGPVFCAWICPFGLLSELTRPKRQTVPDTRTLPPLSARPFWGKLALAVAGLISVALLLPAPLLNQLSMPGWYSRFCQHLILYREPLLGALICIPLALLIERLARKRLWCRYCCPQSVLISLAALALLIPRPLRLRVRFTRKRCTCAASDRACRVSCSLDLDPRSAAPAQSLQCTNCGDCITACKKRGKALNFGLGS